jgi:PAS domain S-box-containing protein
MGEKILAGTALYVLSLEDSQQDYEIMCEKLINAGFELNILRIEKEKDYEFLLRSNKYNFILADFKLPGFDAFGALRLRNEICPDVPFICVSGTIGEETAVELLKMGAVDYVLKDKLERLPFSIQRALNEAKEKAARLESEERFRAITTNTPDHILIQNRDLRYLFVVNPQLGLTEADMIGRTDFDFLEKEDAEYLTAIKKKVLETGKPYYLEIPLLNLKGETEYFEGSYIPKYDSIGNINGLIGYFHNVTERIQSENRLRESEMQFRNLFENSIIGISQALPNGHLIRVNDAYAKMYGYENSEEIISNVSGVEQFYTNQEDRYEVLRILAAKGIMEPREIEVVRRDGTHFFVLVSAREIRDSEGNLLCFQAEHFDITERKQSDEALRESEEKYRDMVEQINDVIFTTDTNGIFTYVSPTVEVMGGYQPEDMLGHSMGEFLDPIFIPLIKEQVANVLAGISRPAEYRVKTKSGELLWMRSSSRPIVIDNKPVGLRGVLTDITERKRVEKALSENEERFRTAFEFAPMGVSLVRIDGSFIQVNTALCKMLGYSKKELLSKNFYDISHPDDIEESKTMVKKTTNGSGLLHGFEKRYIRKDGKTIWVEISSSLLRDDKKQPLYFIVQTVDITERKRTEEELIKAKEKAEESDMLKTAFLHNISHEIRTPMNSIVGFADMLNEPDLHAENRKQFTDIIIQSSNHLLSIISDIVNIATIEAGQAKINSTTIKLNSTLQLIHEQFFLKAKKLNIDLNLQPLFKYNEDLIYTDETKLVQIISNLISNALKFTSKGHINFGYNVVETRHALSLQFFVEDTGIGIPFEMHEEIFTRFRQVENAATRQFGGSGLGLSISKAYVELLGGEMWVKSDIGKGSTFYFTIPFLKVENIED